MPNVKYPQTNFSSGELSERAQGRTDITRYANAAKILENVISRSLGSADKRPGLGYLCELKDMTKHARLVPYVKNRDLAYMLEMGDGYIRVHKTDGTTVMNGLTPYEIASPYDEDETQEFDLAQGEEAAFLFHEGVYPQRLRRFGDARWDVSSAPFTTTPFAELGDYPNATITLSANTVGTGRTATASASVFMASDVGRAILCDAGVAVITAYTSATAVTVEIKSVFDANPIPAGWNLDASPQATLTPSAKDPIGASITLTLGSDGWRSSAVGAFVRANGGLVQITSVSSATSASAKIIKELTSITAVPALAWTLESAVWGGVNGYPRTGTFSDQRLVAAGSPGKPQTIWGSRSGEPLDFTLGTNDDDAYSFTIGSSNDDVVSPIGYLASDTYLLALTYGGEFSLRGSNEKPVTPTNVRLKPESPYGCKNIPPIKVGKETLFAQRAGKKLRATKYAFSDDGYDADDLTTLGEHLTKVGIAGYCYQQEPEPIVWVWLQNGGLVSVTLDRKLDVVAWNRHRIDGAVEWVSTVPAGDRDQVWMIVRRKLGDDSIVRYIERFEPDWYPIYGTTEPDADTFPPEDSPFNWGYQLDCAVTMDDVAGKATWDSLDHLEGRTVGCIADGVWMGTFPVEDGEITLPRAANRVLIGLVFLPRIQLLSPEIQLGMTSFGSAMSTSGVWVHVLNTIGLTVNGEEILPGRINGPGQFNKPSEPFTGRKKCSQTGWTKDGTSEPIISQQVPLPFSLLSVTREITANA